MSWLTANFRDRSYECGHVAVLHTGILSKRALNVGISLLRQASKIALVAGLVTADQTRIPKVL